MATNHFSVGIHRYETPQTITNKISSCRDASLWLKHRLDDPATADPLDANQLSTQARRNTGTKRYLPVTPKHASRNNPDSEYQPAFPPEREMQA